MAHIFLRRYFNINLLKKRHLYMKLIEVYLLKYRYLYFEIDTFV